MLETKIYQCAITMTSESASCVKAVLETQLWYSNQDADAVEVLFTKERLDAVRAQFPRGVWRASAVVVKEMSEEDLRRISIIANHLYYEE